LIEIDYEVLPHVIDVDEAMKLDAPLLFEDMITRGVEPPPTRPRIFAQAGRVQDRRSRRGLAEADEIVDKEFKTAAVHQPISSRMPALPASITTARPRSGHRARGIS